MKGLVAFVSLAAAGAGLASLLSRTPQFPQGTMHGLLDYNHSTYYVTLSRYSESKTCTLRAYAVGSSDSSLADDHSNLVLMSDHSCDGTVDSVSCYPTSSENDPLCEPLFTSNNGIIKPHSFGDLDSQTRADFTSFFTRAVQKIPRQQTLIHE